MKTTHKVLVSASILFLGAGIVFFSSNPELTPQRAPANIDPNYDSFTACDKQNALWNEIQNSKFEKLPELRNLSARDILKMSAQELTLKGNHTSDYAPSGWKKYIHGRSAVAKVKFVPHENSPYTGVFLGSPCAILRLSITYKPGKNRPFAPGLALKFLRDGKPSGNISALYSLDGQGFDFNFFKHPLSNIIPKSDSWGQQAVSFIFSRVSDYPEEIRVEDLAKFDSSGASVPTPIYPRQIFFKPTRELTFSSEDHDIREDFFKIPEGSVIYQVFAVSDQLKNHNYNNYDDAMATRFLNENSILIGEVISTSPFVASAFGDDGIFFRHEMR